MDLGLEWGGNWKTIVDEPHFQLRPEWAAEITEGDMLAELRSRGHLLKTPPLPVSEPRRTTRGMRHRRTLISVTPTEIFVRPASL